MPFHSIWWNGDMWRKVLNCIWPKTQHVMYRHADGRTETTDRPLRRHTVLPEKQTTVSLILLFGTCVSVCHIAFTVSQSNIIPNRIWKQGFKKYKTHSAQFPYYSWRKTLNLDSIWNTHTLLFITYLPKITERGMLLIISLNFTYLSFGFNAAMPNRKRRNSDTSSVHYSCFTLLTDTSHLVHCKHNTTLLK